MHDEDVTPGTPIEDPPTPALAELQQRDLPYPAVPVKLDGPIRIQRQPARTSSADVTHLEAGLLPIVGKDFRRSRLVLIGTPVDDEAVGLVWYYSHKEAGVRCPWPINVPLVLEHAGDVWAAAASAGTVILSTIVELYAD